MITQVYSWQTPAEGANPWLTSFESLVREIDTSVASVEQVGRPRVTTLLDTIPTTAGSRFLVTSDAMLDMGATDGAWQIASCAPLGEYVGSFQLVGSGAQAVFRLHGAGYGAPNQTALEYKGVSTKWRFVVDRTGVNSLVVPSNSAWQMRYNATGVYGALAFECVASLGPGRYRAQLQVGLSSFNQVSQWWSTEANPMIATVTEASLGD